MTPGPPHPFAIAPAGRAPGLPASLPHLGLHSPSGYSNSSFTNNSYTSATSPSATPGSLQETQANDVSNLSAPGISPTQISSSSLNQKRAYRQRRKDPSCDACRERKVKCDATETTACSECSSRNHKCQFTKETNRRMSSIKQVQDLQSRIAELAEENANLKSRAADGNSADISTGMRISPLQDVHVLPPKAAQKLPTPVLKHFEHVRRNVQSYSRGIFDIPPQYQRITGPLSGARSIPHMPARSDFAHLSRAYLDSIHPHYPVLHWPTFQHEADDAYAARSFHGKPQEWIALFFAVMACGALHVPSLAPSNDSSRGLLYYEIANQTIERAAENISITHVSVDFLLGLYATESNMKLVGATHFASSVRLGQHLGLHVEGDGPFVDREVRRRLWWSIYLFDRISSLATNLPMLINDDDCDITMPSSIDDRYIQHRGFARQPPPQPPFTGFTAMVQASRMFADIHRILRSSIVNRTSIQHMEDKFLSTWKLLPESYQLSSEAPLDLHALPPLFLLLTGRFLLFRRNLSPVCQPSERVEALRRCTLVAQETAKYVSRTIHTSAGMSGPEGWRSKVPHVASNMLCMHLWRCILVLCFGAEYEASLTCLHLLAAIDDLRKVNIACGRNLSFFLDRLSERIHNGHGARHLLEYDEEILAYVSGDMQGNGDHSWVWAGAELAQSSPLSPPSQQPHAYEDNVQGLKSSTSLPFHQGPGSPDKGATDWDNWAAIDRAIHQLMEEHRARLAQPSPYYPPPHNPVKRVQLAPDAPASPTRSGTAPPTTSSSSRISIANII